jgi:hypothetical protein
LRLGHLGEQIPQVMGPAPLPGGPRKKKKRIRRKIKIIKGKNWRKKVYSKEKKKNKKEN